MLANLITSMPLYVCTFWSLLLLLDVAENRQTAKARLLAYMVAAALLYAGHFVFFNRITSLLPVSDTVYCTVNLAVFPLYYIYLKELTEPRWNHRWQWLLLVPAAVAGVAVGLLYTLQTTEETGLFITEYLYNNRFDRLCGYSWWLAAVHQIAKIVFALQIPPILILGFIKIRHYHQALEANYADTDDKRLRGAKTVLVLFVVTSFVSFAANLTGRIRFTDSQWLLIVPSLLFSVLQFMLGYTGYRQRFSIRDLLREFSINTPGDEKQAETDTADGEQRSRLECLPQQIADIVSRDKLYLQLDLKITDVADRLRTNRTYVSRVLKEQMGTTFADYINSQRIEYACQLMNQQPQLSATDVAIQSGFSSLSSFYRNFKLYKGCTPKKIIRM